MNRNLSFKELPVKETRRYSGLHRKIFLSTLIMMMSFVFSGLAVVTVNVTGPNGESISGFRWLIEEDQTFHPIPGVQDPNSLAYSFHRSYMPLVDKGHAGDSTAIITTPLDPAKYYYISVLPDRPAPPDRGWSISGGLLSPGQTNMTIVVHAQPIPTAQIAVFVFHDNFPINNAPDLPEEQGLAGFQLLVEDAGGRYGASAGFAIKDAFDNPLGTTYERDINGNYIFGPDNMPIVDVMGTGVIMTDAEGRALIKNLAPGKYGIQAVPPAGSGWQQTSTIEGTKVIDAWVKAGEPPYFREFGPAGPHVFIGFVQPFNTIPTPAGAGSTISGQVVRLHYSRPPEYNFWAGAPYDYTTPWVGLNEGVAGIGPGLYATPVNPDGTFSIPDVPPGNYQLVFFDNNVVNIFSFHDILVDEGVNQDVGQIPVFSWFTGLHHYVFNDLDKDGFWDEGEPPVGEQNINLRWRDGTIYQAAPTDTEGFVPFDTIFPFFHWLVAEVDFLRFKATGVTVVVDAGGQLPDLTDPAYPWFFEKFNGILNPQPQPDNGGMPYRTEVGPVLTQAFQGFIGQTSALVWGKTSYAPGENGGVSGVVYYSTTRAEDDPRYGAAEVWEPGIPRVQVVLYQDEDADGYIDDIDGNPGIQVADVDNFPFDSPETPFPGPEDVDGGTPGVFDLGDSLAVTWTDSWDDSLPTDCPGDPADPFYNNAACYDGLRNFNQVRPGVFDGGYAFPGFTAETPDGIPNGIYIVEVVPPPGYEIVKEEDKNVDFGDEYQPNPDLEPPFCVGPMHEVPAELSLFPGVPALYAGDMRPLCTMKQVRVTTGLNTAADFFLFTEVPISGHFTGFILDDTRNEFDPNSPQFGEKYAPPWLPVSIRDWAGREISRVYSDEFGRYNGLLPSTYTMNLPMPSGASPNMITVCLNDPGPIPNPNYGQPGEPQFITDPYFNRQYSQFCYTFQYMPGTTTYLDTPVVPVAAFTGPAQFPLDCELPNGTPSIFSVSSAMGGPVVSAPGEQITIVSMGSTTVPNPQYDGLGGMYPKWINRDYGFGTVKGNVTIGGVPLANVVWTNDSISGTVAPGTTTGQLQIRRGDNGLVTEIGVTVTVGAPAGGIYQVAPGGSIQDVIDMAAPNSLVLVPPGDYEESVVMWKPLQLQGWGAGSTSIQAFREPSDALEGWRALVETLVTNNDVDLLPGQNGGFGGIEPGTLFTEEAAGILVLAKNDTPANGGFGPDPNARIDGLAIRGSDNGGGIMVNGYVHYLQISNNRIENNLGVFGGGIRSGHPELIVNDQYQSAFNSYLQIHHNYITQNSALNGAGGGISLNTGTDYYTVTENFICGNFATTDGAGVAHLGLSMDGQITHNKILFNQNFNQGISVSGGGVFVGGGAPLLGPGTLGDGSGDVSIIANLIQGNMAGAGSGGGIRLSRVNGLDVADNPETPENWYSVYIFNNIIANNVAGLSAGAISLQDSARVAILHNTIVNNDSLGTAGEAFAPGSPNQSTPQPAGIVALAHTLELGAVFGDGDPVTPFKFFSNPLLFNNIIWQNRSFYFYINELLDPPFGLLPDVSVDPALIDDLAVLGTGNPADQLDPMFCILTDPTGYDVSNFMATPDPVFGAEYFNSANNYINQQEITTGIQVQPAFDEGGNFIDARFGPLTMINPDTGLRFGDYYVQSLSEAVNAGDPTVLDDFPELLTDFYGKVRPWSTGVDIGASEFAPDLNYNGFVDVADLAILIQTVVNGGFNQGDAPYWSPETYADVNMDGVVDATDVLTMAYELAGMPGM